MDIAVALNRNNTRNLRLNAGDREQINVTVYAVDGDETPLAVTNARITTCPDSSVSLPVGSQFTVPSKAWRRAFYTLSVEIAGQRRTVASGVIEVIGACGWLSGSDYGGPYGMGIYP